MTELFCVNFLSEDNQLNFNLLSDSWRAPNLHHANLDEEFVVVHHRGLQSIQHELEEVVRVGGFEDVARGGSLELAMLIVFADQ